jgi:hypothetical protein
MDSLINRIRANLRSEAVEASPLHETGQREIEPNRAEVEAHNNLPKGQLWVNWERISERELQKIVHELRNPSSIADLAMRDFNSFSTAIWGKVVQPDRESLTLYTAYRLTKRASFTSQLPTGPILPKTVWQRVRLLALMFGIENRALFNMKEMVQTATTNCEREIRRAAPMMPETLQRILKDRCDSLSIALVIAMKTASRWDDVVSLRRRQVLLVSTSEMLISFVKTKANKKNLPRVDHCVIATFQRIPPWVEKFLTRGEPQDLLFKDLSWETAVARLRLAPPPVASSNAFGTERPAWTTHSMKRGAITVLWEAAAEGLVDVKTVVLVAKHKGLANIEVPSHTVGYTSKTYAVAKAMNTHVATSHIRVEFPPKLILKFTGGQGKPPS